MSVPFTPIANTATISGTEISLISGTTSLQTSNVAGKFVLVIDLITGGIAIGTSYQVRTVSKVNGGAQADVLKAYPGGLQSGYWISEPIWLYDGWDMRMKLFAGSAIPVSWAIIEDIGDGNALTAGAAAISSIQAGLAQSATALSSAVWTNTLAAIISTALDATVSSRADKATDVATIEASLTNIQSRIPTALDGSGNIKAGVQSLVTDAITSIADAVMNYATESGWVNAATFITMFRSAFSIIAGKASGLAITTATTEHFRNAADTKDRAVFTVATDGTRTPTTMDGT